MSSKKTLNPLNLLEEALKTAKRNTRVGKWRDNLPRMELEAEGEDGVPNPSSHPSIPPTQESHDPWVSLLPSTSSGNAVQVEPDLSPANSDDEEDSTEMESAGSIEDDRQSGALAAQAIQMLRPNANDFVNLSERKVQIDLTYLKLQAIIDRTQNLINQVIKTYSVIPGSVNVRQVSPGVFIYNVTNSFLSPPPGSSGSESSLHLDPQKKVPSLNDHPFISAFRDGVKLISKWPGMPVKRIFLTSKGFSEEKVKKVILENPDVTIKDIIEIISKQAGTWRMLNNMCMFNVFFLLLFI